MNGWVFFPVHESLNHDLAIRRFCPARVEEEQKEWEEMMNEVDSFSPSYATSSTSHLAAPDQVDEFVDSFINMDHDYANDDRESLEIKHEGFDHLQDEMGKILEVSGACRDAAEVIEADEVEIINNGLSEDFVVVPEIVPAVEEVNHGVDQGLHLVHLLLACAEAVGCRDTRLAESMLSQIWPCATPLGDAFQRVSFCFAMGLKSRLSLLHSVNANGTFTNAATGVSSITRQEKMEAFHLLYQTTPYIAFGFMAANEAICQAAQGKDYLHIIDLGTTNTLQWPSLIRTLASRSEGPPKKVTITGLINGNCLLELEASTKSLVEDATSMGVPLEFCTIPEPATPSLLTRENLNLKEEETLFVNCVMHLHKYVKESRGSLKAVLQAIKKLNPAILTVVEQDANHNGPFFLGRFLESLHYYSAVFDSLEASLPRNSPQRMKIERFHFAEEIRNIVTYEGSDRIERHERVDRWRRQLGRAGFQIMGLKCLSQARMMLSVYGCDGYTLGSEKGCLLLGWKGRPLTFGSAWQVHNAPSS